jgi:hypothetical protein
MNLKIASLARSLLMTGSLAGMALATTALYSQDGPPPGSARLAIVQGNISVQPAGMDDWGQAELNMPIGSGDRLFADEQSRGEFQAGVVRAYFGPGADVTLNDFQGLSVQLGIAGGSVEVASDGYPYTGALQVQTPNGAVTTSSRVVFRVDVYPDQQSTVITNYGRSSGFTMNGGGGFVLHLDPGQSVQLSGTNPVYAQPLDAAPMDSFMRWSEDLEGHHLNCISARYVSTEMAGYDELDDHGDWQAESAFGPIWFPRVEPGWAPYHYGHWVNRPFYGWTWVSEDSWGAAPFHYGRWVVLGGRWGWIPGPREGHPVWSPAQVVFAGGINVGGVGVSVWFPLGPGEPYKPWYPASPEYINQINISNIHESQVVHVQTNYVNIVNVTNVTNITYVNRTVGVTAMKQEDFASGKSVKNVEVVHVEPQQLAHVQTARPEAKPPAQRIILHPITKPAAVQAARPVLINSKGELAQAVPNAKPVPAPVKAAPPAPKPIPGRSPVGTPTVGGKPVAAPAAAAKPMTESAKPMAEPAKPAPPPMPAKAAPEVMKPAPKAVTPPPPAPKPEPKVVTPPPPPAPKPEAKPVTPPAKPVPPAKGSKKPEEKPKPKEEPK